MPSHDLFKLHKLHGVVGCPPYAKTASEQGETKPCPPLAYGDLDGRLYPCHTKEAAFNSCILAADAGVTADVEANLKKLAHFWGISDDVSAAWTKIAELKVKTASPDELGDDEYALVQEHGGKKIRKFAAFDMESTVSAAEAFYSKRHNYPFAWRKEAATRLLKMSSQHAVILPAYIQTYLLKAACVARPTADSVDEGLVQRMNLAHSREDDVMDKVASLLNKVASAPDDFDSETVGEILALVDEADREVKLAQHYESGRVTLPEEMLVVPPRVKVAAAPIPLINGRSVEHSALTKEALAAVDEGLADLSFDKLAEVLPTLPRPDADLLSRLVTTVKTAAVAPKGTEAASMGMNQSPSAPDFAKAMAGKPGATVTSAGKAPIGQPFSPARNPVAKTGAVAEALARSEARIAKIGAAPDMPNEFVPPRSQVGSGPIAPPQMPATSSTAGLSNSAFDAATSEGGATAQANSARAAAPAAPGAGGIPGNRASEANTLTDQNFDQQMTTNGIGKAAPSAAPGNGAEGSAAWLPPKANPGQTVVAPGETQKFDRNSELGQPPTFSPTNAPVGISAPAGLSGPGVPAPAAPPAAPTAGPTAKLNPTKTGIPGAKPIGTNPAAVNPLNKFSSEVPMGGSAAPAPMGAASADNTFSDDNSSPAALAAPMASPAIPAASAPMAPGMTPHNGVQVANGAVSAGMVGQAPMTPNQQFDFDKSNQAAAAQNGLATTHAPLP